MRMLRILLLAGIPAAAWGQAIVEYGLGVAAAGTAGAGANAGRGLGGIFSNLTKTLNSATQAKTGAAASTTQPAQAAAAKAKAGTAQPAVSPAATPPATLPATPPAAPVEPAVIYEDPAAIKTGMDQAELLTRFGEPAVKITSGPGESLTYEAKDRSVEVEIRAGKVYSVQIKNKARQSAVVVLQ
jgi:hypothetical protein